MDLPELVRAELDDEAVAAQVSLGGEDLLVVTPTRTLIYRAEGLLSNESVEEYGHDAERIEVSEGRRKSKLTLDYGLDGEETFAVPAKKLQDTLHPVLAGVLNAAGITDAGETVTDTFRFSELTLVVTSERVVKHIGAAVWDEDYEEFHYDDVTDLTFEDGSVATSVVLTLGDRQERFKAPNDRAREVREGLTDALLSYHGVADLEAFRESQAPDEDEPAEAAETSFGDGPDPLSANPGDLPEDPENATRDSSAGAGSELSPSAVAESVEESAGSGGGGSSSDTPASTGGKHSTAAGRQQGSAGAAAPDSGDAASAGSDGGAGRPEAAGSVDGEPAGGESSGADAAPGAGDEFEAAGFEPAETGADQAVLDRLDELAETVERQNDRLDEQRAQLERQGDLIEQLIEELRRGR